MTFTIFKRDDSKLNSEIISFLYMLIYLAWNTWTSGDTLAEIRMIGQSWSGSLLTNINDNPLDYWHSKRASSSSYQFKNFFIKIVTLLFNQGSA